MAGGQPAETCTAQTTSHNHNATYAATAAAAWTLLSHPVHDRRIHTAAAAGAAAVALCQAAAAPHLLLQIRLLVVNSMEGSACLSSSSFIWSALLGRAAPAVWWSGQQGSKSRTATAVAGCMHMCFYCQACLNRVPALFVHERDTLLHCWCSSAH